MKTNNKSFTLIELLVVIVIIGILAGVIMISTSSSIDKANFAKAQTFSNTVQEELLLNLVSEWTFDEPEETGRITKDSWGNNHGVVAGAQYKDNTIRECVSGGCYNFNGSGAYIDCGNNASMNIKNSFSISLWIKPSRKYGLEPDVWYYFIKKNNAAGPEIEFGYEGWGDNVLLKLLASNVYNIYDDLDLINNTWYYYVGTYNLDGGKIYRNGSLMAKNNNYLTPPNTAGSFYIGGNAASNSFQGIIDNVRLYNAALSSSQIKQNYIAGLNSMLSNGNISNKEYNERINELAYDKLYSQ
ncbi:MAG TPA: prepilin-type N-terminal cleavage/methylation domain-containing protein [Candidatus Pacearchaeota archaeon]|nr:prepilin-type N-terminal cleavage/methylation domain-containing protein [Candidatus Pacearchaeota archaeon]